MANSIAVGAVEKNIGRGGSLSQIGYLFLKGKYLY
jgi:hypothetical protein